jgi:hypothetical protein
VTVGEGYETGCADPSSDSTGAGGIGHAIDGGSALCVGPVLRWPLQATTPMHTPTGIKNQERLRLIRS